MKFISEIITCLLMLFVVWLVYYSTSLSWGEATGTLAVIWITLHQVSHIFDFDKENDGE